MTSPTDAPRPALGELARTATDLIEALKASAAEWARRPNGPHYEAAVRRVEQARYEFVDACAPELILQLVALATGGATAGQQQEHSGKTGNGQLESSASRDATVCDSPPGWERRPCVICDKPTGYRDMANTPLCVPCHDAMCAHYCPGEDDFLRDFTAAQHAEWRAARSLTPERPADAD